MKTALRVKEVMTKNPACCEPETSLVDVGRLLIENDCGGIPVVDDLDRRRPIGVITDRDIACRAVAEGRDALNLTAGGCMSSPCVTANLEASLEECCRLMERKRVGRIVVVDGTGACCGIVAQADVARADARTNTAKFLRKGSESPPPAT
jgi:CBS domain-containing protein